MGHARRGRFQGVAPSLVFVVVVVVSAMIALGYVTPLHFLHVLSESIAVSLEVGAALGIVYTVFAGMLIGRFFARSAAVPTQFPGVTVIKPLHGDEWELAAHLASFVDQDYVGPVQFVFGVHDAQDHALKAVEALRASYPDAKIAVVADARLYGPNRKIANLINMLEYAEHDILCFADSDVRVDGAFLRNIVGALQAPGVGLVTTVYRGLSAPGFWPSAAAAFINYHFLPGVITGLAIGRARPCFGQSIAMTRETLASIGGLAQFAHHLAEDHAMGEAVRRSGATVVIPPLTVQHACVENTFSQLFSHELRWSRTIRAADRSGHLGAVLMHPFALSVFAVAFSGGAKTALFLTCAALLGRALLVWKVDRATRDSTRGMLCLPLWDLVQFAVYVASFCSSGVVWRGTRFRVDGDGLLSPVHEK